MPWKPENRGKTKASFFCLCVLEFGSVFRGVFRASVASAFRAGSAKSEHFSDPLSQVAKSTPGAFFGALWPGVFRHSCDWPAGMAEINFNETLRTPATCPGHLASVPVVSCCYAHEKMRGALCEWWEGVKLPTQMEALSSGESQILLGRSVKLLGKSGELLRNLWTPAKFHCQTSSKKVAEELLEKSREVLGSPGSFCEVLGSPTPSWRLKKKSPERRQKKYILTGMLQLVSWPDIWPFRGLSETLCDLCWCSFIAL